LLPVRRSRALRLLLAATDDNGVEMSRGTVGGDSANESPFCDPQEAGLFDNGKKPTGFFNPAGHILLARAVSK